ncbi:MAG TPA: hypothetical protein VGH40_21595 [Roseiarcus sp.]|jgi:hypothetical protein
MPYVALFFAGAFLCNCIPHLAAGLRGEPFPSPFASPAGVGDSPPLVNFFWGAANVIVGLALLTRYPFVVGLNLETLAFVLGALLSGGFLARHFGAVRAQRN